MTMSILEICSIVSDHYGVNLIEREPRNGDRRSRGVRKIARARQIAMALAREKNYTLTQIGRQFGRDHTTVIHAVRVVRARWVEDPDFLDELELLRAKIDDTVPWRVRFVMELEACRAIARGLSHG